MQSSIQLTTGTIPSNWFSVSDFQWKMYWSCRSLGNKFDLFLKNLFANYSVHTETKWMLSIQLKIRDVPEWRNFLEKLLESPIIAEFSKCEPFNWKIPKFLVENRQMEIPVWVYLARFSCLFFRNYCSIPRQIFGNSNQKFRSNGKRHKFVSAVYVNEHVSGCCQTRQMSGGT